MRILNTEKVQRFSFFVCAFVLGVVWASSAISGPPNDDAEAQKAWRDSIIRTPVPTEGCFDATYPNTEWTAVQCEDTPHRPTPHKHGMFSDTVGGDNDYVASASGLISAASGTFPTVSGVKGETDSSFGPNQYTLQLNSNYFKSPACTGIDNCQGWQQFLYDAGEQAVFIQYWLLGYGSSCPSGWMKGTPGDCYRDTPHRPAPQLPVTLLQDMALSGSAGTNGLDAITFAWGTDSRSFSVPSVLGLNTGWTFAEFNIFGEGDSSTAMFNPGSFVTVNLAVMDGTTLAPTCIQYGTTGEMDNFTLGPCTQSSGSRPSIQFVEGVGKTYPAPGPAYTAQVPTTVNEVSTVAGCSSGNGTSSSSFPASELVVPPFELGLEGEIGYDYGGIYWPSFDNPAFPYALTVVAGRSLGAGSYTPAPIQVGTYPAILNSGVGAQQTYTATISGTTVAEKWVANIQLLSSTEVIGKYNETYTFESKYDIESGLQNYSFNLDILQVQNPDPAGSTCVAWTTVHEAGSTAYNWFTDPQSAAGHTAKVADRAMISLPVAK